MIKFTYHAPLDPDCPGVRAFQGSASADALEDFERRHRAECERCHVHGAVYMEVRETPNAPPEHGVRKSG
jgi:hypothetical protein